MRFAIFMAICAGLQACSTNISRFDYPALGMNEDPALGKSSGRRDSNGGRQYGDSGETRYDQQGYNKDYGKPERIDVYDTSSTDKKRNQYDARSDYQRRQMERERLPDLETSRRKVDYSKTDQPINVKPLLQTAKAQYDADGRHIVGEGDTLYNISRRYNVTTTKIRDANGLISDDIKLGQHLIIPGLSKIQSKKEVPGFGTQKTGAAFHKVEEGDTLYNISRRHGVSTKEIAGANGITDMSTVKLGQKLVIPRDGMKKAPVQVASIERKTPVNKIPVVPSRKVAQKSIPDKVNDKKIRMDKKIVSTPFAGKNRFLWPVGGRILSQFGRQKSGTMNDGVNLAVPTGTNVKAAEGGVVAYAGNELKGYGNLVLVRHRDNWVTAYAHNSRLMVKRGDKVRRGQVIAKSGKTGSVYQPQLHFELRRGSKPVNPQKYLAMR